MRIFSRKWPSLLLFVPSLVVAGTYPGNEDLSNVRYIKAMALSPQGNGVVAQVVGSTVEGGTSHLYLLRKEGWRRLTGIGASVDGEEASPAWNGAGDAIYYLARRDGAATLHALSPDTGDSRALPLNVDVDGKQKPLDIARVLPAPQGKLLAVVAKRPLSDVQEDKKKRKDDAIRYPQQADTTGLYLVAENGKDIRQVDLPDVPSSIAWAADGTKLMVVTDAAAADYDLGPHGQVWIIDVAGKRPPLRVKGIPNSVTWADWGTRDEQVVYKAQAGMDAPPGVSDIYALDGEGQVRNLTSGLADATVSGTPVVDRTQGKLLVPVDRGFSPVVAVLDPRNGSMDFPSYPSGRHVSAIAAATQSHAHACMVEGYDLIATPFLCDPYSGRLDPLPAPALVPASWTPVQGKRVQWSHAGLQIEGMLYLPEAAAGKKVPLVVNVHGGPTGQFTDGFSPIVNHMVGLGWAVFQPNIRGSTGYGVAFTAANRDDLGGKDLEDVLTGVDAVVAGYPVDPQRMALIGYSYGGEMAGFMVGKTDRFKAIVSGAPVINQISEYGTEISRTAWTDRWFYNSRFPWVNFDSAWKQSPLAYAQHAKTPFLLLQGDSDVTDPLGQSHEMYRALRQQGVPVEMIVFPREGHPETGASFRGFSTKERYHGEDLRRRMVHFISEAFAGNPAPATE